jgi:dTDP-4-dehydrorhamnose reductase
MVCAGKTSRFEVAEKLVEYLGLTDQLKITPVTSDYFREEYYAERPASERLVTKKLDLRGVNKMRDWKVSLQEYLTNYYQGYLD